MTDAPRGTRQHLQLEHANHALLDETAKLIIKQLQEDGRRPYATIGRAVGLSEAAVRQRVQRLIEAGVMQIVAVTDPLQLGLGRQAMIGVRTSGDLEAIADQLAKIEEVDYVVITAGSYDIFVEAVCKNDAHLLEILQEVRNVRGVNEAEVFVYLSLRKQTYSWGA
ncbi:MAG TPA: AsnC family transcriptional regulator [Micromonosporaceae bacterium]|nr:AsnC family transcriptional regulator [Micromonosporaceae bacterium]HCU49581.1 AsnC family transcriptional regulator [Micromonosporaceae bacterium]